VRRLATEEEIEEMWLCYHSLFLSDTESELDGQTPIQMMTAAAGDGELGTSEECFGYDDLGVDKEKKMSLAELKSTLGITDQFPGFNKFVNRNGASPWEDHEQYVQAKVDEGGEWGLLGLRWHQYVGLHALIRELMSESVPATAEGVLLADKVGVGKTALIIAFIAILNHTAQLDKAGTQRPPALGEFLFYLACPKIR
jgi:hypothetical protein